MMRHEAFRTTFHVIDGEIVQKVNKEVNIEVNEIELEGRLEELMISSLIKPFNLQHGPLIRVAFCKISESRSYMMLDMHHIISDAESQAVLIRELNSLYNGVALEEQKLQYRDYALWQQEFLKSEEYKKQELFWLNVYKKRPENCYIPTDFVREEVMESRCEKVTFSLPETLNEKLDYFISSHNVTKFMMFLSVANIVVSQYSGRSDVILGIPLAGRQRRELENVMGIFVNTLAVKNNVNYEMKYYEFLSEIRANTLAVFENQDVQLEQLIELLDLNGNIFFNTVFVMQNTSFPEIDLLDAKLTFFEMDYEYSKFDLVISVVDQAHLHEIVFKYNSSLFRRETVETLADMFHEYLRKVIEFPGRPLIEICRLSDPESYELGINPKKELESSILFADFNFNW
jgi:bacitracin synthase 3